MKNEESLKIAIAQINPKVGDFDYNKKLIIKYLELAKETNSSIDLLVFPELCICGYDPRDLGLREDFYSKSYSVVEELVALSINYDFGFIVGSLKLEYEKRYNSAFFIHRGKIFFEYKKRELPNYGIFDEKRLYSCGSDEFKSIDFMGFSIGLLICEDLWIRDNYFSVCENFYKQNSRKLDLVITINASPFWVGKKEERVSVIQNQIRKCCVSVLYVNMVGAQDGVVYDGGSMYFDSLGDEKFCADFFNEGLYVLELFKSGYSNLIYKIDDIIYPEFQDSSTNKCDNLNLEKNKKNGTFLYGSLLDTYDRVYDALVLGLRDYARKNNFSSLIVGYSSGIDSTLVALIAMDSIGAENVNLICLPSIYTSNETFNDSKEFLKLIGFEGYKEMPINKIYDIFVEELGFFEGKDDAIRQKNIVNTNNFCNEDFCDKFIKTKSIHNNSNYGYLVDPDVALQNLQSRIRGNILMYFANKNNSLLLTTGNKSEISVGYCTLYGDTNGGFSPIKDLYKTQVYEIAKWRNQSLTKNSMLEKVGVIPENILRKSPSAELKFNQKDSDLLPEYDVLDKILILYIDGQKSVEEIIEAGFDRNIVKKIANLVRVSQFKRSQSAIGTKISKMSFDLDFRYPITNGFT